MGFGRGGDFYETPKKSYKIHLPVHTLSWGIVASSVGPLRTAAQIVLSSREVWFRVTDVIAEAERDRCGVGRNKIKLAPKSLHSLGTKG